MNKSQTRLLKSHYLARWAVLRHNHKNANKVLLVHDQFVLKNLLPGSTLCYNCLGDMYQGIVPDLHTNAGQQHNNLVLINNVEFKYKNVDELAEYVCDLAQKHLLPKGRVILSIEHRFLIYDRVAVSVQTMLLRFVKQMKNFVPVASINLLGKAPAGYGDYFFCLDRND